MSFCKLEWCCTMLPVLHTYRHTFFAHTHTHTRRTTKYVTSNALSIEKLFTNKKILFRNLILELFVFCPARPSSPLSFAPYFILLYVSFRWQNVCGNRGSYHYYATSSSSSPSPSPSPPPSPPSRIVECIEVLCCEPLLHVLANERKQRCQRKTWDHHFGRRFSHACKFIFFFWFVCFVSKPTRHVDTVVVTVLIANTANARVYSIARITSSVARLYGKGNVWMWTQWYREPHYLTKHEFNSQPPTMQKGVCLLL